MPKHCLIPTTELAMRAVLFLQQQRTRRAGIAMIALKDRFSISQASAYRLLACAEGVLGLKYQRTLIGRPIQQKDDADAEYIKYIARYKQNEEWLDREARRLDEMAKKSPAETGSGGACHPGRAGLG